MERPVAVCLVLTLSLVSASPRPHGYGATSGAVAKAEASAGAGSFGSLPLVPLTAPGDSSFSGTFSKSSSSSFASASASSSSFSYSGAGAGLVPGFGTNTGCGGDCQNSGRNELGSSGYGSNNNGGHSVAGASARAIATVPAAVNQPCTGADCISASDKKCTSGHCDEADLNANGSYIASTGTSHSASNDDQSNDYAVNVSAKNEANKHINGKIETSNGLKQSSPVVPFDKTNNGNGKASDCEGQDCGAFLPLAPQESDDNNLNPMHLETQYQEKACSTHDCHLESSNQRKPSSYNVPILGNPQQTPEKENPICTSSKCRNVDTNNYNGKLPLNVNPPSPTLQLPSGPTAEDAPCNSKDCFHLSYPHGQLLGPTGSLNPNTQFLNSVGASPNPSYDSNRPSHAPGVFRPTGPFIPETGSSINPSYVSTPSGFGDFPPGSKPFYSHSKPTGSGGFDNNPSFPSSGSQGLNIQPLHHYTVQHGVHSSLNTAYKGSYQPVHTNQSPTSQPSGPSFGTSWSGPSGSGNNPSGGYQSFPSTEHAGSSDLYQKTPNCISVNCGNPSVSSQYDTDEKPSHSGISSKVLTGSDTDLICTFGNCANQPQSSHAISKPLNVNLNLEPPHVSQSPTGDHVNLLGCTTPDCHNSFGSNVGYENRPISTPGSSIKEKFNPSKAEPEVLLSNKGSKIYSGGFGGPIGIISSNNNDKPSSGIFIPPSHPSGGHNTQNSNLPIQPQTSNEANFVSSPIHSQKPLAPGQQPLNKNNINNAGAAVPNVANANIDENKRPYTGGFGGPAGLLKPNEFQIPPNTPKGGCSSGNCYPSDHVGSSVSKGVAVSKAEAEANAAAVASDRAASFSGTFGGPPGLLKPYDDGKLDQTGRNVFSKHSNNFGNILPMGHVQPHSNGIGASQASAVATASSSAGSYGPTGLCNSGCPSHAAGQDQSGASGQSGSGVQGGVNLASAISSAKSVASSYTHGRSVATASAHAAAGASA